MDEFKGLGYSDSVSRYFSKMKVLDNALGILIEKLKENNILDNTVIILTGDHYPMRLSNDEVSSIVSHDISDKDIEKVPLLIYNPKLKSQTINTYSSYVDVLPTITNLFNLEYDSRIYFGSDLFSKNNDDMIIFPDGSWKNKYAFYNAELSNIKYYDENKYSENDIIEINNKIYNLLESSHLAIEFDYFSMFEDTIINCHKD